MAGVVEIPVARRRCDPRSSHAREQPRARIRRLDVKRRRRDAVLDRPVHRPPEHVLIVVVHAEDEAAVDHDAEAVQPVGDGRVVAAQILALVAAARGCRASGSRSRRRGCAARPRPPARSDRRAGSESTVAAPWNRPAHAAHAVEQRLAEAAIAEEMIVEEIQMAARQPRSISAERVVHALGVERSAAARRRRPCSRSRSAAGTRA